MSYRTQAILARDGQIHERIAACAAKEGILNPVAWADMNQWRLAAQPGWGDAYSYAINAGTKDTGNDESVITDSMILSGVQSIK